MQLLRSLLRLAPRARPDAPAPDDHRRAARLTGVLYGALQLGALFPGLVITVLADEIGTSDDTVQLVLGLTAAAGVLVTGYWLARGASLQSRGRLAGSVLVFGAALVGLGVWPSLWTFAAALLLGAALAPSAMLARHIVARQFPGREGDFLGISQTWSYLARALGGLTFALAVFGLLDLRWATAALGGVVLAAAAVYACWPRLRGGLASAGESGAARQTSVGRLLGSPSLRRGLLATLGVYAAFQLLWSELQPRVAGLEELSDRGAAVLVAVFGLTVVLSIPSVRKHASLSDVDGTRSATEASVLLVLAAALGLLSLAPGMDQIYLLIPLLAAFTAAIDIGGNATSAAVTTALTVLDRRATLMSALARSLASVVGGVLAAAVGWTGAVWAIFVCAVLTWATLRRRQRHPTDNAWVEGSHETLRLILVPGTDVDRGPASFTIALAADGETVGPWEIWRRDAVAAKSPRQPEVPRSERIEVFEIRFDWPLGRARRARRTSGRLHPFARVPVVLDGERRGTLVWRMWSFGRWSVEDGTLVLSSPALAAPTEVVHLRHGPM